MYQLHLKISLRDYTEQCVAGLPLFSEINSSAGCWADCLSDLFVKVAWWVSSAWNWKSHAWVWANLHSSFTCIFLHAIILLIDERNKAEYAVHTLDMQKSASNFRNQSNFSQVEAWTNEDRDIMHLKETVLTVKDFLKCEMSFQPLTLSSHSFSLNIFLHREIVY